jgi:GDP-L-fucose synthase
MMGYWSERRVLVTGGGGFLGSFVVDALQSEGCKDLVVPRSAEFDLVDPEAARRLMSMAKPHVLFHLAAQVGGIGANRARPGLFFYENLMMGLNLMEEARQRGVEKFVQVGTVCSYPKNARIPFREADIWNGYPEETNAPYGIAKKALLVQLRAYRQQYGFRGIYLIPTNLYGPGDNFDLSSGHVIPALIRKCLEAKRKAEPEVTVWGTGKATRDFLFVEDCATALVRAAEGYDRPDPLNLGSGREVSIGDLARIIARMTGFSGALAFDPSFPDGQPRRVLDTSRAKAAFEFHPEVDLEEGLRRTIAWYSKQFPGEVAP